MDDVARLGLGMGEVWYGMVWYGRVGELKIGA